MTRVRLLHAAAIACLLGTLAHDASAQTAPARPCTADASRHFDFWEGRWVVRAANGPLAGHSTVSVMLGECVLLEHYTTPSGYEGQSLNIFDASRGVWHQTWTDNGGLLLVLEGGYQGDTMVMQGETVGPDGAVTINRISWSRMEGSPDRVRQHWESSTDGGTTWATGFDGHYVRQSSSADWDVLIRGGTFLSSLRVPLSGHMQELKLARG